MNQHDLSSYAVYGLRLVSDRPIPGLNPIESNQGGSPDVSVRFEADEVQPAEDAGEETLWYTSDIPDEKGNPALKIWKRNDSGEYRIRYSHGLTFYLNASVTDIRVRCDAPMAADDVADFLLGPVLGIVLRLRGVTCLHASAVSIGGKAIAFVGVAGAGKSTTAALFARKGHSVLADDIAALVEREGSFYVLPAYPYLNLWPVTVEMLSWLEDRSLSEPTVIDMDIDKVRVPLNTSASKFQREALPLAAIYILEDRSGEPRAPFVDAVAPPEALMSLVANTYGNTILDAQMKAQEFRVLGELTKLLPIRRVVASRDSSHLDRLYEVISQDFARIAGGAVQESKKSM
ncbi:MAG: hypothetical protein ACRD4H_06165 [Candidatus Acidiferrales bacterium]